MANTSSLKLGWIGIGRMGYAMAERLAKSGTDLTVWNRTRAKAEPLAAVGAKVAGSPADLAGKARSLGLHAVRPGADERYADCHGCGSHEVT